MINNLQEHRKDTKNGVKNLTKHQSILLSEAKKLHQNGFWIVPTIDKISQCKNDKNNRLSYLDFESIVIQKNCNGLGILTNEQNNYVSFDLDTKDATNPQLFERRLLFELGNYETLKSKIKLSKSPSGGFHLYVATTNKNSFIGAFAWSEHSNDNKQKQTITGRSLGQYCCEFPTPRYEWIIDNDLQELTSQDENDLKTIFSVLNEDKNRFERIAQEQKERFEKQLELRDKKVYTDSGSNVEIAVWDDFNNRNTVGSILIKNGFNFRYTHGDKDYYLRDGSTSKSSGFVENNLYVNFSDNAGLPQKLDGGSGRKFNAFDLVVHFNYNGDYSTAAKDLISQGYGKFKIVEKFNYSGSGTTQTPILNQFILSDNQFIGNVLKGQKFDIGLYEIKGGTGVGKSRFISENFDKIIVVSRNNTTLENYSIYGFTKFLQSDSKNHFLELQANGTNKIVVTYKSFKNLRGTANLDGYTIVFDEAHLLSESFKEVRIETEYCYNSINELRHTNTVILMSANDIHTHFCQSDFKAKYTFKKPSVKRSVVVVYNASNEHLIETILKRLGEGKKVLLYTNRKEEKYISEVIKTAFQNNSICFYDATKHGKIDLKNLQNDITVCTSALVTGKDVNNENLSMIFYGIDKRISRSTINQFLGRGRKYKTHSFDVLFEFKNDNENFGNYSNTSLFIGAYGIAKATIEASVNDWAFLRENKERFVTKDDNGKLIVNWFQIINHVQQQISKHTILNTDVLSNFLGSHGYDVTIEILTDTEHEKQEKQTIVTPSELYVLELNELCESKEHETEFLTNVLNRFEALKKVGYDRETALDILNLFRSKMNWIRFVNLIIIERSLTSNDIEFIKLYNEVLAALDSYYNAEQIIEKLQVLTVSKKAKKTDLGRLIESAKRTKTNDLKKVRFLLKNLRLHYDFDTKKIDKKSNFKIVKTDYLQGVQPFLSNVKELFLYSDIL
jgi:hypothetical protein